MNRICVSDPLVSHSCFLVLQESIQNQPFSSNRKSLFNSNFQNRFYHKTQNPTVKVRKDPWFKFYNHNLFPLPLDSSIQLLFYEILREGFLSLTKYQRPKVINRGFCFQRKQILNLNKHLNINKYKIVLILYKFMA